MSLRVCILSFTLAAFCLLLLLSTAASAAAAAETKEQQQNQNQEEEQHLRSYSASSPIKDIVPRLVPIGLAKAFPQFSPENPQRKKLRPGCRSVLLSTKAVVDTACKQRSPDSKNPCDDHGWSAAFLNRLGHGDGARFECDMLPRTLHEAAEYVMEDKRKNFRDGGGDL